MNFPEAPDQLPVVGFAQAPRLSACTHATHEWLVWRFWWWPRYTTLPLTSPDGASGPSPTDCSWWRAATPRGPGSFQARLNAPSHDQPAPDTAPVRPGLPALCRRLSRRHLGHERRGGRSLRPTALPPVDEGRNSERRRPCRTHGGPNRVAIASLCSG